jgi:hypothetical protein
MMTSQGLQTLSAEDSIASLRIVAGCIVTVNVVFHVGIAGCRG